MWKLRDCRRAEAVDDRDKRRKTEKKDFWKSKSFIDREKWL